MKEFEDLPKELQIQIEDICDLDQYSLSPSTLY